MTDLVPSSALPAPASAQPGSALDRLLDRALVHERMGGRPSPFLLWAALGADLALAVIVLLGSTLSSEGVRHSSFFVFGGGLVGGLIGFLQIFTWPLLVVAGLGIALNVWCRSRRTPAWAHVLLAGQVVPTVTLGSGWLLVLVAFAIALILWILFIALMTALVCLILGGLIAAAGS
jgi:hypothetical protein